MARGGDGLAVDRIRRNEWLYVVGCYVSFFFLVDARGCGDVVELVDIALIFVGIGWN